MCYPEREEDDSSGHALPFSFLHERGTQPMQGVLAPFPRTFCIWFPMSSAPLPGEGLSSRCSPACASSSSSPLFSVRRAVEVSQPAEVTIPQLGKRTVFSYTRDAIPASLLPSLGMFYRIEVSDDYLVISCPTGDTTHY